MCGVVVAIGHQAAVVDPQPGPAVAAARKACGGVGGAVDADGIIAAARDAGGSVGEAICAGPAVAAAEA